jgi:feruloyl esterase
MSSDEKLAGCGDAAVDADASEHVLPSKSPVNIRHYIGPVDRITRTVVGPPNKLEKLLVLAVLSLPIMAFYLSSSIISLLAVVGAGASTARPRPPQSRALSCATSSFTNVVKLSGVTVTIQKVQTVQGNYTAGENTGFPLGIDLVPKVCAVTIHVVNTTDTPTNPQSTYNLGLFLPDPANYNNRFLAVGSYSFAGGINWPNMAEGAHYGFATMSTDNGHTGIQGDIATWGNDTAKQLDWGYRAFHGSVVVAKLLTNNYYGSSFSYSYYSGCSTGGRQGLREVQYDADTFDGVLVGAAAWDTLHLMPWISKMAKYLLDANAGPISSTQASAWATETLNQCDGNDSQPPGQNDNIISEPSKCNFDFTKIQCTTSDTTSCLTAAQISAVKNFYTDYTVGGNLVSHGYYPGAENDIPTYFGAQSTLTGFDFDYERYMMKKGASFSYSSYTDSIVTQSEQLNPGSATANKFDMRAYRTRGGGRSGGKILMYHGTADALIPTRQSEYFYQQSASSMGTTISDMRSWFRLFEVPGMNHCFFSNIFNAPWHFGAPGANSALRQLPELTGGFYQVRFGNGYSVPNHLSDPQYDILMALVQWVENGRSVDSITATAYNSSTTSTNWPVYRTRVICPYPQIPTYNGSGSVNSASNWHCA